MSSEFPGALQPYADQLEGRSMLVKRAQMFPVECVARGYLAGSGWKEYQASGNGVRHRVTGGAAGWIATAGAAFYACHEEPGRHARREHFLCGTSKSGWRAMLQRASAPDAGNLSAKPRNMQSRAA